MITRIKNGRFILPDGIRENLYLYFEDGKITHITSEELSFDKEIDTEGKYVSPGFIDLHLHGGGGYRYIDATKEAVHGASNMHGSHGTTTLYPTLSAFNIDDTMKSLDAIRAFGQDDEVIPNIPGVHLEGPYFSPKQCGAQDPNCIKAPDEPEYTALVQQYGDLIKRWSYAPELDNDNAFQKFLNEHDIVGSAAHTDAEFCHMKAAYEQGLKLITHLYSCTSTIVRIGGFRHLGVVESAYYFDDMDVETIADGCHLPPELLQLIYKLKGDDHMCLVTDAIRFGGCKDCDSAASSNEGASYIIEDGVAKLPDRSAFAGSIATADVLIRTCTQKAGISLPSAVKMMTQVPARIMKLTSKGSLSEGFDADIIFFDEDILVSTVITGGQMKHIS